MNVTIPKPETQRVVRSGDVLDGIPYLYIRQIYINLTDHKGNRFVLNVQSNILYPMINNSTMTVDKQFLQHELVLESVK